jgi:hypothetical protein
MDFAEWLQSKGIDAANIGSQLRERLQARWRDEMRADFAAIPFAEAVGVGDDREAIIGRYLDQYARPEDNFCVRPAVEAAATAARVGQFDRRETELYMMRAARPLPVNTIDRSSGMGGGAGVLEAGLLMQLGMPNEMIAKHYGERVVDAATQRQYRSIGLHGIMRHTLAAAGRHVPQGAFSDTNVREVFEVSREMQASSGVSTYSLPGILSNVANKLALEAFQSTAGTWMKFCKQRPCRDFKELNAYRLTALDRLAEVPDSGEIKHGSLTESPFTNQAKTYGRMISITRKSLINDDLSMLDSLPAALGRLGMTTLERAVYTLLLANTGSFFHASNANLLTGGGSVLALAGLDDAIEAFEEQKDANNDPIMIPPRILLVPSALHATGRTLMNSQAVIDGTATAAQPDGNPWRGFLDVVSSPFLGATIGLTGNSDTAWYVLAEPGDYAIIEVAFLDGRNVPTVQTADLDFNVLGIQMRVIFDFGVAFLEPKGGVKSAGA